jgi:hypothetical protein
MKTLEEKNKSETRKKDFQGDNLKKGREKKRSREETEGNKIK